MLAIWSPGNMERFGRRLAGEASRTGRYPLLMLPSTDAAFRLLAACEERGMPVRAVGNPGLAESWGRGVPCPTTPGGLWSALKAEVKLPFAVAVFEDQLVAIDDSYLRVELDGQTYMVSPIVAMILMKFRPPSYLGGVRSPRHGRAGGLSLTPYSPDVPPAISRQALNDLMGEVLRPLLACAGDTSLPWHARPSFALKRGNNFNRVLIQQIQEMESLVRLCCARRPEPAVPGGWLDVLRASRLEMVRQLQ